MDTGGRVERFQRRVAKGRLHSAQPGPRSSSMSRAGRRCADLTAPPRRGRRAERRVGRREVDRCADGDGELSAQRDAPVGGQAVLEGVMMRGVSNWAVAVRKPTAEQLQEERALARGGRRWARSR